MDAGYVQERMVQIQARLNSGDFAGSHDLVQEVRRKAGDEVRAGAMEPAPEPQGEQPKWILGDQPDTWIPNRLLTYDEALESAGIPLVHVKDQAIIVLTNKRWHRTLAAAVVSDLSGKWEVYHLESEPEDFQESTLLVSLVKTVQDRGSDALKAMMAIEKAGPAEPQSKSFTGTVHTEHRRLRFKDGLLLESVQA